MLNSNNSKPDFTTNVKDKKNKIIRKKLNYKKKWEINKLKTKIKEKK
jgi:hypothetical protein